MPYLFSLIFKCVKLLSHWDMGFGLNKICISKLWSLIYAPEWAMYFILWGKIYFVQWQVLRYFLLLHFEPLSIVVSFLDSWSVHPDVWEEGKNCHLCHHTLSLPHILGHVYSKLLLPCGSLKIYLCNFSSYYLFTYIN